MDDVDGPHLFDAYTGNVKTLTRLLKSVHFRDSAMISFTERGLKVVVEESKCAQATCFIDKTHFEEYYLDKDERVTIKVNLKVVLDCLSILGGVNSPGSCPVLKMWYSQPGFPLNLIVEERDVLTECHISTLELDDVISFDFDGQSVEAKAIVKAEVLKEAWAELDGSSDSVTIMFSPIPAPNIRITTRGNSLETHFDIPAESDSVEIFQCYNRCTNRYRLSLMKLASKPLQMSQKVSLKMDARGLLCMQFMMRAEERTAKELDFVDFYCCPDEDQIEDR